MVKDEGDACMVNVKPYQTKMIILRMFSTKENVRNNYNEQCTVIVKRFVNFRRATAVEH